MSEKDNLWCLGNTTIRNPERLPGALKVFIEKFHGKESFARSQDGQQSKFEKELGYHTPNGKLITKGNQIPIVNYDPNKLTQSGKEGKNARQWLSIMDDYGFVNSYNTKDKYKNQKFEGKTYITKLGVVFVNHEILRDEIWLRQILKFQAPHYKKQLNRIRIRSGWWFLKLIIECEGLTSFELGIASLFRTEEIAEAKKNILDWRVERERAKQVNQVNDLKASWKGKLISLWFANDWQIRETNLKKLIGDVKNGKVKLDDVDEKLRSKDDKILGLGKGAKTKRAISTANQIQNLLVNSCYDVDQHIEILKKYFGLVKGDTIWNDYVDANTRMLKMTGFVNWIPIPIKGKDKFSNRLKIYGEHLDMIKDAVENLPCLKEIGKKNEMQRKEYYEYLVDVETPRLKIDDNEFVEKKNNDMEKELKKIGKTIPRLGKYTDVNQNHLRYNLLRKELEKEKEENFIQNLSKDKIIKEIEEMIKNPKDINPITLESVIWKAVASLGGYQKHISETRNFGLDSNFDQIFTAGGGVPDMKFHYSKFDEIVEVTKMGDSNKSQLVGEFVKTKEEKKPVPTHVAEHKFYNEKETNCIFIAPSIHLGSIHQCWLYSCKKMPIAVKGNFKQRKPSKISFHIVPLTLEQFLAIFQVCIKNKNSSGKWIDILTQLHKITNDTEKNWMTSISDYVKNL